MADVPTGEGELDALVRRVDPDRWLSSRFIADPEKRADVVALYAYDYELARAEKVTSNPLIAEIRLTWWREVLDEIFGGRPVRAHPVARALQQIAQRRGVRREWVEVPIDARIEALGASAPEGVNAARVAGGSLAVAAAVVLGENDAEAARPAGELWAMARAQRGNIPGREATMNALVEARIAARRLSPAAFPAIAHAALARVYATGKTPSAMGARLRVLASVLTGAF